MQISRDNFLLPVECLLLYTRCRLTTHTLQLFFAYSESRPLNVASGKVRDTYVSVPDRDQHYHSSNLLRFFTGHRIIHFDYFTSFIFNIAPNRNFQVSATNTKKSWNSKQHWLHIEETNETINLNIERTKNKNTKSYLRLRLVSDGDLNAHAERRRANSRETTFIRKSRGVHEAPALEVPGRQTSRQKLRYVGQTTTHPGYPLRWETHACFSNCETSPPCTPDLMDTGLRLHRVMSLESSSFSINLCQNTFFLPSICD